jgi:hypothetical protein
VEYLREAMSLRGVTVEGLVETGDERGLKQYLLRGNPVRDDQALLHMAAKKGNLAMLRLLLAAGLSARAPDKDGRRPAEVALLNGHMKAFELLDAAGGGRQRARMPAADGQGQGQGQGQADGQPGGGEQEGGQGQGPGEGEGEGDMALGLGGKTPLHAAAECGSVEAIRAHAASGVWPVDGLDGELNTPLHCAIMAGHLAAAAVLVRELKADVNKRNRWGTTPLAEAVRLGHDDIADLLRDQGACLFLEIDSQQVVMEPRDQYFLRLELAMSLLYWAALTPRPAVVRFFHTTHHNSLLLCCSVRPRMLPDNRSSSSSIRSCNSNSSDQDTLNDNDGNEGKGEAEADAVLSHLILDQRAWFLHGAFTTGTATVSHPSPTHARRACHARQKGLTGGVCLWVWRGSFRWWSMRATVSRTTCSWRPCCPTRSTDTWPSCPSSSTEDTWAPSSWSVSGAPPRSHLRRL